ncbi:hypothetical protein NBRC111894_804 [Sporolactobacillus inulinus]|uniref:Uncharacterized protein n=1 Tax=Sporolactobacillus inulinus TaxID=2078 RepID=A0A4Y1Z8E4_9BACL|nr:hypothetical protein NBRC111894_804 [Sporolactobacillus inulinus]
MYKLIFASILVSMGCFFCNRAPHVQIIRMGRLTEMNKWIYAMI